MFIYEYILHIKGYYSKIFKITFSYNLRASKLLLGFRVIIFVKVLFVYKGLTN